MGNILSRTYETGAAVTQSDTVADPAGPFAALYFGAASAGSIKLTTVQGATLVFQNVQPGATLLVATQRVWSTTTTGSANIIGLNALPFKAKTLGVGGT